MNITFTKFAIKLKNNNIKKKLKWIRFYKLIKIKGEIYTIEIKDRIFFFKLIVIKLYYIKK